MDWPRLVAGPLASIAVKYVTAGVSHVIAITNTGCVWTWGQGDHGQLGHGDTKRKFVGFVSIGNIQSKLFNFSFTAV